jgi:hypothetical protein
MPEPTGAYCEARITLDCPSGHDDCTTDCGRCKGQGIVKVPVTESTVAWAVAVDFRAFERHEMPAWPNEGEERDRELVAWKLRCLANPRNGWSVPALAAIVQQAATRTPASRDLRPGGSS